MLLAEFFRIAASSVVIATYRIPAKFPGQINHFIRVGAVADNIAKIPDDVVLWRGAKNSLECLKIRMNV